MKPIHVVDATSSPTAALRPVPVNAVQFREGSFWEPWCRVNREKTVFSQHQRLEEAKSLDNFRIAAGRMTGKFIGPVFTDSDIYKWLESAAWCLATHRDEKLEKLVDETIELVTAAQQPDGYLNTHFMFDKAAQRWSNLRDWHEMYCAGHLIQAAVAHHRATGKTSLLDVATRVADNLISVFGSPTDGKREGVDGHEEVEMALIELFRDTGQRKYLDLASYFLHARGRKLIGGGQYHQDHKPIDELDRVTGHAVRMMYLACGIADLALESAYEKQALMPALDRIWSNMTERQMYVTGGIGSRHEGEAFGRDYELPNERAYTETCAAIGSIMWNHRMLLLTGEARFADEIERALFNGFLSGLSFDGEQYFYVNPLSDDGTHRRQKWFGCACCPPNVARTLGSLGGYIYSVSADATRPEVFVHQYAQSRASIALPNGESVVLEQTTIYPWDGTVTIRLLEIGAKTWLTLRIPAWCEDAPRVRINGNAVDPVDPIRAGRYLTLSHEWRSGDVVTLELPMPTRLIECHPHVSDNANRVAVTRGPIVYCAEQVDNRSADLRDVAIRTDAPLKAERAAEVIDGVTVIRATGRIVSGGAAWTGLYRPMTAASEPVGNDVPLTLVPYYAWANREPGRMQVWFART